MMPDPVKGLAGVNEALGGERLVIDEASYLMKDAASLAFLETDAVSTMAETPSEDLDNQLPTLESTAAEVERPY